MEIERPRVSIIVLNWNGLKDTVECLQSLKAISYPSYEVVVVDNASTGDDVSALKRSFGDFVRIVENDKNYGYTGGNNIGLRLCLANSHPDYLLILNNDIVVAPDFLDHLVRAAEAAPSMGMAGPKVYYFDDPNRIQNAGTIFNMWKGEATSIGSKQLDTGLYDSPREADAVSGSCLLVRREVIEKVGAFDESYFAYWDDTDYCTRARKAGYSVIYVPQARVWHKNPIKQKIWDKTSRCKTSTQRYYYSARNNFKFMKKYANRAQYAVFLIYFFTYRFAAMSATCLLYDRSPAQFTAFCRGVKDGLFTANR
jgi:GT2 family glycosyltransferase